MMDLVVQATKGVLCGLFGRSQGQCCSGVGQGRLNKEIQRKGQERLRVNSM